MSETRQMLSGDEVLIERPAAAPVPPPATDERLAKLELLAESFMGKIVDQDDEIRRLTLEVEALRACGVDPSALDLPVEEPAFSSVDGVTRRSTQFMPGKLDDTHIMVNPGVIMIHNKSHFWVPDNYLVDGIPNNDAQSLYFWPLPSYEVNTATPYITLRVEVPTNDNAYRGNAANNPPTPATASIIMYAERSWGLLTHTTLTSIYLFPLGKVMFTPLGKVMYVIPEWEGGIIIKPMDPLCNGHPATWYDPRGLTADITDMNMIPGIDPLIYIVDDPQRPWDGQFSLTMKAWIKKVYEYNPVTGAQEVTDRRLVTVEIPVMLTNGCLGFGRPYLRDQGTVCCGDNNESSSYP